MSRRQRHLTLRPSLGSALQLDSRAVAESVGTTVQTWVDRSGLGRNPTQATSTLRPIVVTGESGQTCLEFDGADDRLEIPSSTAMFNGFHNGQPSVLFAAVRPASPAAPAPNAGYAVCGTGRAESGAVGFSLIWENRSIASATNAFRCDITNGQGAAGGYQQAQVMANNQWPGGVWFIVRLATDADALPVADRIIGRLSGGPEIKGNIRSYTPSASNATYNMQIGNSGGHASGVYFGGRMAALIAFTNHSLSAAIQRRIEHAMAYSFKIPCA